MPLRLCEAGRGTGWRSGGSRAEVVAPTSSVYPRWDKPDTSSSLPSPVRRQFTQPTSAFINVMPLPCALDLPRATHELSVLGMSGAPTIPALTVREHLSHRLRRSLRAASLHSACYTALCIRRLYENEISLWDDADVYQGDRSTFQ